MKTCASSAGVGGGPLSSRSALTTSVFHTLAPPNVEMSERRLNTPHSAPLPQSHNTVGCLQAVGGWGFGVVFLTTLSPVYPDLGFAFNEASLLSFCTTFYIKLIIFEESLRERR